MTYILTPYLATINNLSQAVVENAAYLGLLIPGKLHKVLEQLHDRAEKEDDAIEEKKGW